MKEILAGNQPIEFTGINVKDDGSFCSLKSCYFLISTEDLETEYESSHVTRIPSTQVMNYKVCWG